MRWRPRRLADQFQRQFRVAATKLMITSGKRPMDHFRLGVTGQFGGLQFFFRPPLKIDSVVLTHVTPPRNNYLKQRGINPNLAIGP